MKIRRMRGHEMEIFCDWQAIKCQERKMKKKTKKMMERNQQTPSQLYSGALSQIVWSNKNKTRIHFPISNQKLFLPLMKNKNKEKLLVCFFFARGIERKKGGIYFFQFQTKKKQFYKSRLLSGKWKNQNQIECIPIKWLLKRVVSQSDISSLSTSSALPKKKKEIPVTCAQSQKMSKEK